MSEIVQIDLAQGWYARVDPKYVRSVPQSIQGAVDAVWARAQGLVDRPIVSVIDCSRERLIGELVPFKAWYAAQVDPSLRPALSIRPLGVSGRVFFGPNILVGRRSNCSSTYPGAFECCPSGSVDCSAIRPDGVVDIHAAFMKELLEETGISSGTVSVESVYFSPDDGIFDIQVDCIAGSPAIPERTEEYDQLFWMDLRQPVQNVHWVPLSLKLLKNRSSKIVSL